MEKSIVRIMEIQEFLEKEGIKTHMENLGDGNYRIYTTCWHYDIYCETFENSESFALETFNMNIGEFGNRTTRKSKKAVLTYFNKFITKAWNW